MENASTTRHLVRMVGVMAIGIALAWAFQVLGFAGSDAFGKLMWTIGAAAVAGSGCGLLYSSSSLEAERPKTTRVSRG